VRGATVVDHVDTSLSCASHIRPFAHPATTTALTFAPQEYCARPDVGIDVNALMPETYVFQFDSRVRVDRSVPFCAAAETWPPCFAALGWLAVVW
jgi:hypothetical protein